MTENDIANFYSDKPYTLGIYLALRKLAYWDERNTLVRFEGRLEKAKEYTYFLMQSERVLGLQLGMKRSTLRDYLTKFSDNGFLIREVRQVYPQGRIPRKASYFFRITIYLTERRKWLIRPIINKNPAKFPTTYPQANRVQKQILAAFERKKADRISIENPALIVVSYLRKSNYTSERINNTDPVIGKRWKALFTNLVSYGFDPDLISAAWMWLEIAGRERGFPIGNDALYYFYNNILDVCDAMHDWSSTKDAASEGGVQSRLILDPQIPQCTVSPDLESIQLPQ